MLLTDIRRVRHNSDPDWQAGGEGEAGVEGGEQESLLGRDWLDNYYSNIPFEFATTFKSDDDWLDDFEECDKVLRKPFTFDDRVEAYR